MLHWLFYPLRNSFIGFNLLGYITFRSAAAAVVALLVTFLAAPRIIRYLKSRGIGETIRRDGPQAHHGKAGTPTLGGLIILLAVLVSMLLFGRLDNFYTRLLIGTTLWFGAVGFVDDWLKVVKKYPKGLIGRYKLAGQILWGIVVAVSILHSPEYRGVQTFSTVPFFKNLMVDFGLLYIPMVIFVITATSNAVNLTDGLDGLAIGLVGIAALAWAGISYVTGRVDFSGYLNIFYLKGAGEITVYCAALIGASISFLWYNSHPASVFMGDTGALM
ncbi:MAG TPA: phospho-N-acetylmuramoyl-pentapeptide-transferase, partial [bacterium]